MHKDFYASGFLYHPRTQQILLQQKDLENNNNEWSLLSGTNTNEVNAKETFLKTIELHLNLKLKINAIFSVYDYSEKDKDHYILYANVNKLENFEHQTKKYSWFTFKQINKLQMLAQTKQDLIIGQRVIDSSIRKKMGIQTIG